MIVWTKGVIVTAERFAWRKATVCLFIFGEDIKSVREKGESRKCPVCDNVREFEQVSEVNYFTLFFIRLFPVKELAAYQECTVCETAFDVGDLTAPSNLPLMRKVIAYFLLGYGKTEELKSGVTVFERVTGVSLSSDLLREEIRQMDLKGEDLQYLAIDAATRINLKGKLQILEAAYLVTWMCCDLMYEDRLRINLLATSLGLSIESVDFVIGTLSQREYLGLSRFPSLIH